MDQMTLFMVVGGLLVLTLVLASIAQRYHAFVEERRQHVQRILKRVGEIDGIIQRMTGLPVPIEAERILRRDIIARLQALKGIHARYDGIDRMIREAQQTLEQVSAKPASTRLNEQQLVRLTRLTSEIEWLVQEKRLLIPVSPEEGAQLLELMRMRRAESLYNHHLPEANRLANSDQIHQALWHCEHLKKVLKSYQPENQQINAWYLEVEKLNKQISKRLAGG
ncbi:MAG: hypothetical protein KZQ82_13255 [Candidatus Thiodiazotropha sp. (ex Lucinoma annulata)]|nr:hypothetical protein [Candidatus Thiodiazotropha sp. (ex Lucinoma annulata)]